MKVSLSWLKEYVPVDTDISTVAEALTMAGLEVDAVTDRYGYLKTVVAGKIIKVSPHPNADRLQICDVDTGDKVLNIVCGAPNVKKDMMAPCALLGTVFPDGNILEKGVIRGCESEGMLCSKKELGIDIDSHGIMSLDQNLTPGTSLVDALALSDVLIEIDLTPNRPDCLGIIGVAREIAAFGKTNINIPDTGHYPETSKHGQIDDLTSVTIENPDLCPRYSAGLIFNITIGPSPSWLQDRLLSVGLRPINNIVDITNFVMMETGQPLHAFDFDRLEGRKIVVRAAGKDKTFSTLDNKKRQLLPEMLMICDGEKPVALAGVMGGLNSEIDETTTKVLLESAYFDPSSIRKTSKKLNLNTDATHRFERGIDPSGTVNALKRAAVLMAELGGGNLVGGIIDEHPEPIAGKTIILGVAETNRLLGTEIKSDEIKKFLESVGFGAKIIDDNRFSVDVPLFRVDVSRPEDLMEEIARLWGYNNIPTTFPMIPAEARKPAKQVDLKDSIKNFMVGFGFMEVINYSFISKQSCDRLELEQDDPRRNEVEILNPLTEDQAVMRTSLIPGLFGTMFRNNSRQIKDVKIFEIGKVFISSGNNDSQPNEKEILAGLWTGTGAAPTWDSKGRDCDFYDIKGVVEGLLKSLNIENIRFDVLPADECSYIKPGYSARIFAGDVLLGLLGKTGDSVLKQFNLKQKAFVFELDVEPLVSVIPEITLAEPIPKFPAVSRDITIIVDKEINAGHMLDSIKNVEEELIEEIFLFDVYEGKPVPAGRKSISFRIIYRSSEKTLEDDHINRLHQRITEKLLDKFNATFP